MNRDRRRKRKKTPETTYNELVLKEMVFDDYFNEKARQLEKKRNFGADYIR